MAVGIVLIFIVFLMFILPQTGEKRAPSDHQDVEGEAKKQEYLGRSRGDDRTHTILVGSDPKTALLIVLIALVIMLVLDTGIQTQIGNRREDVNTASALADVCELI